jgi:hypothetical protein
MGSENLENDSVSSGPDNSIGARIMGFARSLFGAVKQMFRSFTKGSTKARVEKSVANRVTFVRTVHRADHGYVRTPEEEAQLAAELLKAVPVEEPEPVNAEQDSEMPDVQIAKMSADVSDTPAAECASDSNDVKIAPTVTESAPKATDVDSSDEDDDYFGSIYTEQKMVATATSSCKVRDCSSTYVFDFDDVWDEDKSEIIIQDTVDADDSEEDKPSMTVSDEESDNSLTIDNSGMNDDSQDEDDGSVPSSEFVKNEVHALAAQLAAMHKSDDIVAPSLNEDSEESDEPVEIAHEDAPVAVKEAEQTPAEEQVPVLPQAENVCLIAPSGAVSALPAATVESDSAEGAVQHSAGIEAVRTEPIFVSFDMSEPAQAEQTVYVAKIETKNEAEVTPHSVSDVPVSVPAVQEGDPAEEAAAEEFVDEEIAESLDSEILPRLVPEIYEVAQCQTAIPEACVAIDVFDPAEEAAAEEFVDEEIAESLDSEILPRLVPEIYVQDEPVEEVQEAVVPEILSNTVVVAPVESISAEIAAEEPVVFESMDAQDQTASDGRPAAGFSFGFSAPQISKVGGTSIRFVMGKQTESNISYSPAHKTNEPVVGRNAATDAAQSTN